MTEEELKAALEKAEQERDALKETNKNLKSEKSDLARKAKEAEDAVEDAKQEAAEKAGDIETLKASLAKQHKAELDKIAQERDAAQTQLKTLLIDNTISKALVDLNVKPDYFEPLTAMFRADAELRDGKAMRGDEGLLESITAKMNSDFGKHYVMAPVNTGAGATGSTTSTIGEWAKPPVTGDEIHKFSMLAATDPVRANSLADSWNMPHLKV